MCIYTSFASTAPINVGGQPKPNVCLQLDDSTLEITELPIRKWTQDYKEFLETLIKPDDKATAALLADYKENHTDKSVHFTLQMAEGKMPEVLSAGLYVKLKLTSKISIGELLCHSLSHRHCTVHCTGFSRFSRFNCSYWTGGLCIKLSPSPSP